MRKNNQIDQLFIEIQCLLCKMSVNFFQSYQQGIGNIHIKTYVYYIYYTYGGVSVSCFLNFGRVEVPVSCPVSVSVSVLHSFFLIFVYSLCVLCVFTLFQKNSICQIFGTHVSTFLIQIFHSFIFNSMCDTEDLLVVYIKKIHSDV